MEIPAGKGKPATEQWSVGRGDAAGRTDLLGMIDPVVLQRLKKKGAVTEADFQRQSGTVHIWEEDASIVLRTFGVHTAAAEALDHRRRRVRPRRRPAAHRARREGKLARIRKKRRRADNAIESLDLRRGDHEARGRGERAWTSSSGPRREPGPRRDRPAAAP
jgi:hypothetical protein